MSAHRDNGERLRWLVLPALIVLAGVAAYTNSFWGDFIFGDRTQIVSDELRNRPVLQFSLAVNDAAGGLDVFGYHLVNLAIHLAAGLTLFGLVRRTLLLPRFGARYEEAAEGLAFAVAIIWLVHPLATESVTHIFQRAESLMGLFYLLTLYCLLRGSQASRVWLWYVASVAACWLGMGTKQVMITAPVVALLFDRVFLTVSWRELFRRRWAIYLGFAPAVVWLLVATQLVLARQEVASAGLDLRSITWVEYLGTEGGVILHYLGLAFWPEVLSFDYWWPVAQTATAVVVPGLAVALLLAASLAMLRYRAAVGFLGVSFFLILAPTSSVIPLADPASEHRMYLPLAPVVVLVVLGFDALVGRYLRQRGSGRLVVKVLLAAVVLALALRTIDRNRDYCTAAAMWQDVIETAPHNPRGYYHLGNEMAKLGDDERAVALYRQAVERLPSYARAHNKLGVVLVKQGKPGEAAAQFRRAVAVDPQYAEAHYHLAGVLKSQRRLAEAIDHFRTAVGIREDYVRAHYDLGVALVQQGAAAEATAHFRSAVDADPDHADAHYNLGIVLTGQEDLAAAVVHYQETLRIDPTYATAHNNLGTVHAKLGDFATSENHFMQAVAIRPDFAVAHDNLGNLLVEQRRGGEAAVHFRRALVLRPGLRGAAMKLVRILAADRDPAVRDGGEAVRLAKQLAAGRGKNDPLTLDLLAAAYAEAGRWDEAVATAKRAVELASSGKVAGQDELVGDIEARLKLYQQQKPFRDRTGQ